MAQYVPDSTKGYEADLDNLILALKGTTVLSGGAITAQATPDMTVDVAAGVIRAGGAEFAITNTDLNISAADASNARIDLIVKDTTADGAPAVVAGTPSSTPKPPALPANRILLGYVSVAAAATNIQNSNISDRRIIAGDGIVSGTAASIPAATTVPAGTLYYDTTNVRMQRSDGTNWTNIFGDATILLAGLESAADKRLLAYYSAGNSGASLTIDWNNGASQHVTMTGNCTFTFSNPAQPGWYALRLAQDGTGSRTATWPATVKWSGAAAPTLTTTASRVDLVTFYWDGAAYLGASILNFTV